MAPVATEFEKIINTARERKKNEALADKIFSRGRRQSAPTNSKPQIGGSLASRVGVKKSQPQNKAVTATSSRRRRASVPAGDVNGEWTHDLHSTVNRPNSSANAPLSSRITLPGGAAANSAAKKAASKKKVARLTAAFDRMETDDSVKRQVNIVKNGKAQARDTGMTIRGLAGPFAIMAQNFAPGTTAADIESAMTPVGGEMVSCEIVKTQPFIIVEMVFASREGGEKVIETFDNKTADGRIIKVYPKPGGYKANRNSPFSGRQKTSQDDLIADYNNDLMDRENVPPSSRGGSNRLQYNNDGNKNNNINKRGRGFQKGSNNGGR
ncbi:hypothetical protein ACSS6W_007981 [Trichoderma asperelloides]|nr:hypothetical protein LI328DRAFT_136750 [Trichoderma asperelloides]